ncbi:MAG TPA: Rieske 2Fe-2S domain-containing protein [Candidatus Binataceae bacterium]|nr:Rieske 2Fe-2S domain-containing protein [Candidatus Binataceae bacterium]HVB81731.1 Rieske 2Fe-2S domain-containing protein [Candidatus Binataceae bacterium]
MKKKSARDYDTLIKPDRVHSRLYTDPEIFDDELERIFHRGWVFVGHASEVPNPGDFRLKRIGRQPVIMVRDQAGQVNLLLNRCRHRGATVCSEERGNARSFRCAYHGWTYKLDGTLAGVPYPDGYDEQFRREEYGLVKVPRIGEHHGFIFGSVSPAGITFDEHLGRGRGLLDRWIAQVSRGGELDASIGLHKYRYRGNWKLQVENSLDGYHPPFVHQSVMLAVEKDLGPGAANPVEKFQGATGDLGGGHVTLTQAVPVSQAGAVILFIFPNLALVGIQMRMIQPVGVDHTEVTIIPTLVKGASEQASYLRLREHEGFFGSAGGGSPDDTEVFERVQAGFAATTEPWILFSRGKHRERADPALGIVGDLRDEVSQRGIWRQWKKVMNQQATESRPASVGNTERSR